MKIPGKLGAGLATLAVVYSLACSDMRSCNTFCNNDPKAASRIAGPADKSRVSPEYGNCVQTCYAEGVAVRDEINRSLARIRLYYEMNDQTVNETVDEVVEYCLEGCAKK